MKTITLTLLTLILLSSCANHLKDFAQQAETVSLEVVVVDGASVDFSEHSLLGNVVSAAMSASKETQKIESRLQSLLTPAVVKSMVVADASERLGSRIPFAVADGETDGQLEILVNQYGISQFSGKHAFTMDFTMSVFSGFTGEQVYSQDFTCSDDSFFSFAKSPGNVFNTAATVSLLNNMTDDQVRQSLEAVVEKCTQIGLSAMRARATN